MSPCAGGSRIVAGLLGALWSVSVWAGPLVVLDPGHDPDQGGATGIRGIREVAYNDRFVGELAPALRQAGWEVRITRGPEEHLDLKARAQLANRLHATLFLSIHHDSAQARYLKRVGQGNHAGYQTTKPIEGYSLYVSRENPDFAQSYRLAALLGEQLLSLGRPPALHHAENIPGEGRPLLDRRLGIYQYDQLAVLRHSQVPAVLLEVGVITDRQDEAYVNSAANRKKMIGKIVEALRER